MSGIWITGNSRSGKTDRLIDWFGQWCQQQSQAYHSQPVQPQQLKLAFPPQPGILVLSAIGDNRELLQSGLTQISQAKFPFRSTTPLGFFEDEVKLFWALLVEELKLPAQFPLRLRPETEQELAHRLWQEEIQEIVGSNDRRSPRIVRRMLDLLQLAALSQTPASQISQRLQQAFEQQSSAVLAELPIAYDLVSQLIEQWRQWCQARGLLSYSLIAELYGQYLLPHPRYQAYLKERYQVLIADDVDEYPALARSLFEQFLAAGSDCIFSFNPSGAVRLGLGADPRYMEDLSRDCQVQQLEPTIDSLVLNLQAPVTELVRDPIYFASLPEQIQTIQATTRAQLIRQTAEFIGQSVRSGQIQPQEIAIIGPGLDPISRYAFREILARQGIAVELLNDQRPLASSALIRALLTLLTLLYPGLGRLVNRDLVAEMLVVLSNNGIDPVRAGLLADHCFEPDVEAPKLLSSKIFPRWDRLGFEVSDRYEAILQWLTTQQQAIPALGVVECLDLAIQTFFLAKMPNFEQLSVLRELMETAQHYWEVEARLQWFEQLQSVPHLEANQRSNPIDRFIRLLRDGTVTANPFPVKPAGAAKNSITLATVFQYRSSRRCHRWQFWFDAGTPRWLSGIDSLFGAPLFLQAFGGAAWTIEDQLQMNEQRLYRILQDLLSRTTEQVFLCYSDLSTNGQEQTGVLLPLVNAALPYTMAAP